MTDVCKTRRGIHPYSTVTPQFAQECLVALAVCFVYFLALASCGCLRHACVRLWLSLCVCVCLCVVSVCACVSDVLVCVCVCVSASVWGVGGGGRVCIWVGLMKRGNMQGDICQPGKS